MIPAKPETDEALRARYPEALRDLYNIDAGVVSSRPGEQRKHVFDTKVGVRLIISRDKADGKTDLHVSASWWKDGHITLREVWPLILDRITSITGIEDPEPGLSEITRVKGVPHFLFPDPGPPAV